MTLVTGKTVTSGSPAHCSSDLIVEYLPRNSRNPGLAHLKACIHSVPTNPATWSNHLGLWEKISVQDLPCSCLLAFYDPSTTTHQSYYHATCTTEYVSWQRRSEIPVSALPFDDVTVVGAGCTSLEYVDWRRLFGFSRDISRAVDSHAKCTNTWTTTL